mmetsp:Transcript_26388/g.59073  ORF Transcript_26388/g.59073 Transcript_26388/m.59073 type:complete len:239 (+) Transcript_26388:212-928(+)
MPMSSTASGRTHGFQRPYSKAQYRAWFAQALSLTFFYGCALFAFLSKRLDHSRVMIVMIGAQLTIVLVELGLWHFLETHDPSEPSCFSRLLISEKRWTTEKYCRIHKKRIAGLDHFCEWLNVSIGRSNYVAFLLLVAAGLVQFCLQIIFGVLVLVGTQGQHGAVPILLQVIAVLLIGVSLPIATAYSMLFFFHLYLGWRGISTYDYTIEQSKKHKQPREAKVPANHENSKGALQGPVV